MGIPSPSHKSSHSELPHRSHLRAFVISVAVALACLVTPTAAHAENLIKSPGAHNQYSWELEPQLVLRTHVPHWGRSWDRGYNGWAGIGPGVRVSIPFMHNGPIDEINNNIGISFGASTTWHAVNFGRDVVVLNLPVAFQWNFYFTDIISVLGEVGLNTPLTFWGGEVGFSVEPLMQGGGRFQFGKVGVLVRVGWPLLSVGANFQF